ncbi:hypothetical protein [Parendozoicomonas sp. Alg238-R29]|nr:hypothetical protein [Parendozoicomonas sp. Alg238-R29]
MLLNKAIILGIKVKAEPFVVIVLPETIGVYVRAAASAMFVGHAGRAVI